MRTTSTTWKHIRRSPYQAAAAVMIMFLTFLLAGIFFVASVSSALILQYFESKPEITVFFLDKATKIDAEKLATDLKATGKVSSVRYVTKDDALAIYREQNKSDPLLLEMVTADILPASLEVSATDPTYLKELAPMIAKTDGVEEVVFQRDVVESLISWARVIRIAGLVLVGLLALTSILTVMTVVSMKIALKKEEIDILRLIGASSWYIRSPFILEGAFYGLTGAFAAWIVIACLLVWFQPTIMGFLGMIPLVSLVMSSAASVPFWATAGGLLGIMTVTSFLLGSIGSSVALDRFLKNS